MEVLSHTPNLAASSTARKLYPDLVQAGSLAQALQIALDGIHSPLIVTGLSEEDRFIVYASVDYKDRACQVYVAANQRLFLLDFWQQGVQLAKARSCEIGQAAEVIHEWLACECSLDRLEQFPSVTLKPHARAFENGTFVEYTWRALLQRIGEYLPELEDLVQAASRCKELRELFPFTSLYHLCLSHCTGYPYTRDIPYVTPQTDGTYVVTSPDGRVIGQGAVEEAVQLLVDNLPPGCGPAVSGTAETIDIL